MTTTAVTQATQDALQEAVQRQQEIQRQIAQAREQQRSQQLARLRSLEVEAQRQIDRLERRLDPPPSAQRPAQLFQSAERGQIVLETFRSPVPSGPFDFRGGVDAIPVSVPMATTPDGSLAAGTRPLEASGAAEATPISDLSAEQEAELARRHAPILYLHPDEQYSLEDPHHFLEQAPIEREADGDYRDLPDTSEARAGDRGRARMLYQYDYDPETGTRTLTYHVFYAYNDGPGPGAHEGDWERITLQLDENYEPTGEVLFSGHETPTARAWEEVETEDGRLVVYVARGSHANYPEEGEWRTDAPGPLGSVFSDDARRGERIDLSELPAADVRSESYYGESYHWGERGTLAEIGQGFTSGPLGPSDSKGALDPAEASPEEPLSGAEAMLDDLFTAIDENVIDPATEAVGDAAQAVDDHVVDPIGDAADAAVDEAGDVIDDAKDFVGGLL